jgi:hypothetical protein
MFLVGTDHEEKSIFQIQVWQQILYKEELKPKPLTAPQIIQTKL